MFLNAVTHEIEELPAQFAYVPYPFAEGEAVFDDLDSTGLACASDLATAAKKALLEVLERDAFMKWWRGELHAVRIESQDDDPAMPQPLMSIVVRSGLALRMLVLTPFPMVRVVLSFLSSEEPGWPHIVLGLGCSDILATAIRLSLEEALLSFLGYAERVRHARDEPALSHQEPEFAKPFYYATTQEGYVALVHRIEEAEQSDYLRLSRLNCSADFSAIANVIYRSNYHVLWREITTPDIAIAGMKVVRVICPQAQRLDRRFTHDGAPYGRPHPFP